jgi:WD40-like Beta Propeller Repeat
VNLSSRAARAAKPGTPAAASFSIASAVALALLAALSFSAIPASGQKPAFTMQEYCSTFAFGPEDRIAIGVYRVFNHKKFTLEGDDLWISSPDGKRKRIIEGEKLVKTDKPQSFKIHEITWSPDGQKLAIYKTTYHLAGDRDTLTSGDVTELLDIDGREITIQGAKENPLIGGYQATWLADGATVAFLTAVVKPRELSVIHTVKVANGEAKTLFEQHQFVSVAWDAAHGKAIAIERDRGMSGPAKLVSLDLVDGTRKELADLQNAQGQLTISPSGKRIAFFFDGDLLEVRDLATPTKFFHVRVGLGRYEWAPDENHILLKRGPDTRSGNLMWVSIPDGNFTPAMNDLIYRDFHISQDGRYIGLLQVTRNLDIYPSSAFTP